MGYNKKIELTHKTTMRLKRAPAALVNKLLRLKSNLKKMGSCNLYGHLHCKKSANVIKTLMLLCFENLFFFLLFHNGKCGEPNMWRCAEKKEMSNVAKNI